MTVFVGIAGKWEDIVANPYYRRELEFYEATGTKIFHHEDTHNGMRLALIEIGRLLPEGAAEKVRFIMSDNQESSMVVVYASF